MTTEDRGSGLLAHMDKMGQDGLCGCAPLSSLRKFCLGLDANGPERTICVDPLKMP
jgi:hypothetical protein